MTKKKKRSSKKLTANDLQILILKFLLANPRKQYAVRQLIDHLGVDNNYDATLHALTQLCQTGSVESTPDGKFRVLLNKLIHVEEEKSPAEPPVPPPFRPTSVNNFRAKTAKTIEGRVDMTRSGAAYIVSEWMESDVYVSGKFLNSAMHGDTVEVMLFPPRPSRGRHPVARKPEGEVLRVIRRAHSHFIGTIRIGRKYALFYPDNMQIQTDIYLPLDALQGANDQDKVVIQITDWQEGKGRVPIGAVTEVLGKVGGHDFEMKKILVNAGFELSHSLEAEKEAAAIPESIPDQEIQRRRDMRDILTFTIDPVDAKDFDDALSIRKLENDHLEIGIHIADVTHYLKPDSAMDKEAFRRSTSVYLVDRCNPMLPEKLSNNLCSLVPLQDRLTFSAVFEFDKKDTITKRWFGKTIIHSDKRFTYEEAQTILQNKAEPSLAATAAYPQLEWALKTMDRLAKKMRTEREKNGAIGFETEEVRFKLAPDGTPLEAYVKTRQDTNLLIEDFMLLANKEVAWFIDQKGNTQQTIPFVYRVHDEPDPVRIADFSRFALELGFKLKTDTPKQIAQSFNELMKKARTDERLKLLEPLAIRTMAKAVYTTENIGHYGLGFSHYSHFTSPIRRYSDVLAHRILERNLDGKTYRVDNAKLEEQCKHISDMERKAADAERESIKFKQVELISRHIGETFTGIVSGMIDRGLFIELPGSKAEGMIEFRLLPDTYTLEEGNLRARTRKGGKTIKIGDPIQVKILKTDLVKRQIEMAPAEDTDW